MRTALLLPFALWALARALVVPANLINHQLCWQRIIHEYPSSHPNQAAGRYLSNNIVEKYIPKAIELALTRAIAGGEALSKQEKVIITKIYKNLNTICKLNVKELKEVIKAEPAYQEALADLYFDKKLNNYTLITAYDKPSELKQKVVL